MKRFTLYRDNGYPKLKACDLWRTSDCKEECVHCEDLTKAIRRLAELEDKFESGQLVENGSYRVSKEKGYFVITQYRVSQKYICSELTKEAAETRLKELQEKR